MMVNEFKNSSGPWQSTVPQQMPWMSSYEPASPNLQFGQQPSTVMPASSTIINSCNAQQQQQHPFISSLPITTTSSTPPITICPTATIPSTLFTTQSTNVPYLNCVTTTTQSSASVLQPNVPLESQSQYHYLNPFHNQQANTFNPTGSLTPIPYSGPQPAMNQFLPQKRGSIEMEDEQIIADEPPTKQLLSEKKLFRQFGSLNIDGNIDHSDSIGNIDSDDSDEDDRSQIKLANNYSNAPGREEFNRYVYLLFKDKKNDGIPFKPTNSALDRLAREERDKLSKAVILWSPPTKNNNSIFGHVEENDDNEAEEEGEDEEFKYTDHKDFLRKPTPTRRSSITITEVFDDDQCNSVIKETNNSDPDEIMLDD